LASIGALASFDLNLFVVFYVFIISLVESIDMSSLKGKTALVTGSTSGIGLGMALALAKQGVNIMVNGFGEKDEAIAKIKACGVEVDYHGADMSKPAEIEDLIKQTEKRFGALDILINNAGIQHVASIEDFSADLLMSAP